MWPVFEEYRNLLREQGLREPDDAMQDVARIVEEKGVDAFPYKAVIVDEAQDMSPAAFSFFARSRVTQIKMTSLSSAMLTSASTAK